MRVLLLLRLTCVHIANVPRVTTLPCSLGISPTRQANREDLPLPTAPAIPTNWPCWIRICRLISVGGSTGFSSSGAGAGASLEDG